METKMAAIVGDAMLSKPQPAIPRSRQAGLAKAPASNGLVTGQYRVLLPSAVRAPLLSGDRSWTARSGLRRVGSAGKGISFMVYSGRQGGPAWLPSGFSSAHRRIDAGNYNSCDFDCVSLDSKFRNPRCGRQFTERALSNTSECPAVSPKPEVASSSDQSCIVGEGRATICPAANISRHIDLYQRCAVFSSLRHRC